MLKEEVKKPMEKERVNESQPIITMYIKDLTGKNLMTFTTWQVVLIIYNILSSSVWSALQITGPLH